MNLITTRDLSQLTPIEAMNTERFTGENSDLLALSAARNRRRAIRSAIDRAEHCCDECDDLNRMYEE